MTEPRPIVHAAGVIPPEVEQAVTAQIERRNTADVVVAWAERSGVGLTVTDWQRYFIEAQYKNYLTTKPDPTPEPGWLKRRLRRWFG